MNLGKTTTMLLTSAMLACAGSAGSAPYRTPVAIEVGGQESQGLSLKGIHYHFYLEEQPDAPQIRVCGEWKPTGSHLARDTCRSRGVPSGKDWPVYEQVRRLEEIANAVLQEMVERGDNIYAPERGYLVLDLTRAGDEE